MKTKDEVNLLFQNFHKVIETQYNAKVRVLRSDNGGEYQSSDLQKHLEGHGIIHQITCSNTPVDPHPRRGVFLGGNYYYFFGCSSDHAQVGCMGRPDGMEMGRESR